jgi:hypothetical protein
MIFIFLSFEELLLLNYYIYFVIKEAYLHCFHLKNLNFRLWLRIFFCLNHHLALIIIQGHIQFQLELNFI